MNLWNGAILATAAAAAVLLLKLLFGNKITPRGHMLLWLVPAAAILALPLAGVLPESDLAVRNYVPQTETRYEMPKTQPETEYIPGENPDLEPQPAERAESGVYAQTAVSGTRIGMQLPFSRKKISGDLSFSPAGSRLWNGIYAGGVCLALLGLLMGSHRQKRKLCMLTDSGDTELLQMLAALRDQVGIRREAKIVIKQGAETTFLMRMDGRYVIALETGFGKTEQRQVLAHELTHLKHGDLRYNLLAALVLAAFWWNPVIWLAFRRFRRDMEVYCDYDAARLTGDKKAYATALVKAAAGTERFILGTTSFIGGENEVSARVRALAAFKKPKTWIAVSAALVLAALCVCFVVNPRTAAGSCAKYFSRIKTDDVKYLRVAENKSPLYGTVFEDPVVLSEISDIEGLLKIFHGLKKEDFTEQPQGSTGNYRYTLEIILENGEKLSLRGDMSDGKGLYYISKYQEESYERNEINGRWVTCPQLNEQIEDWRKDSLHLDFFILDGSTTQTVRYTVQNTARKDADSILRFSNDYRLERYTGKVNGEMTGYEKEALGYARTGWEEIPKLADAQKPSDSVPWPNVLKSWEWSDAYRIDLYRDYGILPDGIYRITKTFQQKGASGTVQKEHSAVFAGREYRFEKADWSDLLAQPEGRLSETAISRFNSQFAAFQDIIENYNPNVLYCFFISEYSRPEEMNLSEFLRYYPQFTALGEWTPELKEKFENSKFWKEYREEGWTVDSFMVPIHLYRPEVLEESLQYYTGIGLSELAADNGQQSYVEEIDRYVTFTSDAAGDRFEAMEGKKEGDFVTLTGEAFIWKRDESGENNFVTETAVLTLQEKDGRYLIRSFLPAGKR